MDLRKTSVKQKIHVGWIALLCFQFILIVKVSAVQAVSLTVQEPAVGSDGGVRVTATGTFDTCTDCDANGENCTSNNFGVVTVRWPGTSYPHCYGNGQGTATCTATYDRGALHGTHSFEGFASDCKGYTTQIVTLTLDNTPTVSVSAPSGTLNAPFDIVGHASFKPTLSTGGIGSIRAYFNFSPTLIAN